MDDIPAYKRGRNFLIQHDLKKYKEDEQMASLASAFNKLNVIFLALLLVLIMAGELILEPRHLATCPAFLIMIFFCYCISSIIGTNKVVLILELKYRHPSRASIF